MKQKKISVLLDPADYEKFEVFCRDRGHKKSTLISKLVRDFLTSEGHDAKGNHSKVEAKRTLLK